MTTYQTRRHSGEIHLFSTLEEAHKDALDPEVWKISWEVESERRIRLIRDNKLEPFIATIYYDNAFRWLGSTKESP